GATRVDRRGRPRPDGYRMVPDVTEASVVQKVFADFAEGKSITAIVKALNVSGIKGKRRTRNGWSPASVSRLLRNHKYIGRWVWNRTETRHDPRTGRIRKFPKPESDWHVTEDEGLRIVSQDTWQRVLARWKEIERTWPRRTGKRGFEGRQRSYVETHPPHLLSGALPRNVCAAAVAL